MENTSKFKIEAIGVSPLLYVYFIQTILSRDGNFKYDYILLFLGTIDRMFEYSFNYEGDYVSASIKRLLFTDNMKFK